MPLLTSQPGRHRASRVVSWLTASPILSSPGHGSAQEKGRRSPVLQATQERSPQVTRGIPSGERHAREKGSSEDRPRVTAARKAQRSSMRSWGQGGGGG